MELCIIIPARNEALTLSDTIEKIINKLESVIPFNILVINDHSTDSTLKVLENLSYRFSNFNYLSNSWSGGVGSAILFGLSHWKGDIVALCMADGSDAPDDILLLYNKIRYQEYDCAFGSRFINGGKVVNYPFVKLVLNRIFNNIVRIKTRYNYNDFTNIFKVYNRHSIEVIFPIESTGFSIGLEMSLKAFKTKLRIAIIPISWTQRKAGVSKLNLVKNFNIYVETFKKLI